MTAEKISVFDNRIVTAFNNFSNESKHFQLFPHSDFAITLSFLVIGTITGIGVVALKFINNVVV